MDIKPNLCLYNKFSSKSNRFINKFERSELYLQKEYFESLFWNWQRMKFTFVSLFARKLYQWGQGWTSLNMSMAPGLGSCAVGTSPVDRMTDWRTDRHNWKHHLPSTSLTGLKNYRVLFITHEHPGMVKTKSKWNWIVSLNAWPSHTRISWVQIHGISTCNLVDGQMDSFN